MKKFIYFPLLTFIFFSALLLSKSPGLKAYVDSGYSLHELAGRLKSAEDIALFMNRHFRFESDWQQFGEEDYWQGPAEILESQKGDCEDFALFANQLLKMNGKTSFLLNLYGNGFAHTVCVFKENNKYNVIDGTKVVRFEQDSFKNLMRKIYPFWEKAAVVGPSSRSRRGKILSEFERKLRAQHRLNISA